MKRYFYFNYDLWADFYFFLKICFKISFPIRRSRPVRVVGTPKICATFWRSRVKPIALLNDQDSPGIFILSIAAPLAAKPKNIYLVLQR